MTKRRTVMVLAIAVAIAIGLSVPLASAYSGASGGLQGFIGSMMGRSGINSQQQQSPYTSMMGNGYGNGGMMGGYYGIGQGGSSYGEGMMGGGMMGGYGNYNGMMGGYNGSYYGMMTIQGVSVPIEQAVQTSQSPPTYAQITKSNNTISFHSQDINILAVAIMPDMAVNLTGVQPPSYSTGDVFVIYGLINPTLVIPAVASVHFTVVNLDDDMYHNLVVSTISPPYPYMAMQGMMSYPRNFQGTTTYYPAMNMMLPFLPPANYSQGIAHEYSYSTTFTQAGSLWYLCTYPGHAQSGMYGHIVVN
ncbi:MAG: hypothetical protein JRN15_21415 [Nitrososphaerota archaeon]|nr:hypothetical protein [Nitrososphaerota archaeon]